MINDIVERRIREDGINNVGSKDEKADGADNKDIINEVLNSINEIVIDEDKIGDENGKLKDID